MYNLIQPGKYVCAFEDVTVDRYRGISVALRVLETKEGPHQEGELVDWFIFFGGPARGNWWLMAEFCWDKMGSFYEQLGMSFEGDNIWDLEDLCGETVLTTDGVSQVGGELVEVTVWMEEHFLKSGTKTIDTPAASFKRLE